MNYMLLIHQGTTPVPPSPEWDALSEGEKGAVYGAYKSLNDTPGVTPGVRMQPPETATTVRVAGGRTLTTDGPFAETKEQLAGYYIIDCKDLEEAKAWAARIPTSCFGDEGAIEIRPLRGISRNA